MMVSRVAACLSTCLREGVFPRAWKKANLVLVPKGKVQNEGLPKFRPICLLDEIGKVFKRIIAHRLKMHMEDHPKAQLSSFQYGFRKGKSTCDAFMEVQCIVTLTTEEGYCDSDKFGHRKRLQFSPLAFY
ncbi:reverse [Lasius niger]|uniref:Reverse n=1 Tax=Lasius niger TaxID=67767 RepID=A0A0J7KDQ1_LASNI|nr:reverse [Lasius niger]